MHRVVLLVCLAAPAFADASDTLIPLQFSVSSGTGALLSGDSVAHEGRAFTIERRAARGSEKQSLVLEVRALDEGRLMVRASWNDTSADGESVRWDPSFIVKRGAESVVRLDYPGGTRVLSLKPR